MTAQGLEACGMEVADGADVPSHRSDGQVLVATRYRHFDDMVDELAPHTPVPHRLGDDDRLHLPARTPIEQAGQANDRALYLGHPGPDPLGRGQVVIEAAARVVSADGGVPVQAAMVLC